MAGTDDKRGIPLGEYIKFHKPWPYVRRQLDRGALRYTWTDPDGCERASDDGGSVPPEGWWPRPEMTTINLETSEVRGHPLFPPLFRPMFFVRVYPAVEPEPQAGAFQLDGTAAVTLSGEAAAPKHKPRKRQPVKYDLVLAILAGIDGDEGLAPDLQPAEIEKKVLPRFRERWSARKPGDKTDRPVKRTTIFRAYQGYLKARSSK